MQVHRSRCLYRLSASLVLTLALVACSDDTKTGPDALGIVDTGLPLDANRKDAGPGFDSGGGDATPELKDCTGAVNGFVCGPGSICLASVCVTSSCGDGFIDMALGEECEDGNAVSGDGCGLCRWECTTSATCNDGNACNGTESCALATHTCAPGTAAANGSACMISASVAGVCNKEKCVPAGCGNGVKDATEQCDDGDAIDDNGCTRDCKFTCNAASDCNDGNACNGAETCDMAMHKCVAGQPVKCMANGCAGTCDPKDGSCGYPDVDKDGSSCNLDCNDADPATLPGGFECADGKDNDCSSATPDLGSPSCSCYLDDDKDGFAVSATSSIASAGACPAGYTRTKPSDESTIDCAPRIPSAFPGQSRYFPNSYCKAGNIIVLPAVGEPAVPAFPAPVPDFCLGTPSFDYNCDGLETSDALDSKLASDTCVGGSRGDCGSRSGWIAAIPACGRMGNYRQCTLSLLGVCSGQDIPGRARPCR